MTMQDIAEPTGFSVSIVSRAINGKYLSYSDHVMPLKKLFASAGLNSVGLNFSEAGSEEAKELIQSLIMNEDKTKPLTDQQIKEILSGKNIFLSRRVVAKYHEELGLASSYARREL